MNNVQHGISAYFAYVGNNPHSYQKHSIVSKIMTGHTSKGVAHSTILRGIEFTDSGFLKFINCIELILEGLKATEERSYNYLLMRYGLGMRVSKIAEAMAVLKAHVIGCKNCTGAYSIETAE